jgi:hypothetical protein
MLSQCSDVGLGGKTVIRLSSQVLVSPLSECNIEFDKK